MSQMSQLLEQMGPGFPWPTQAPSNATKFRKSQPSKQKNITVSQEKKDQVQNPSGYIKASRITKWGWRFVLDTSDLSPLKSFKWCLGFPLGFPLKPPKRVP